MSDCAEQCVGKGLARTPPSTDAWRCPRVLGGNARPGPKPRRLPESADRAGPAGCTADAQRGCQSCQNSANSYERTARSLVES